MEWNEHPNRSISWKGPLLSPPRLVCPPGFSEPDVQGKDQQCCWWNRPSVQWIPSISGVPVLMDSRTTPRENVRRLSHRRSQCRCRPNQASRLLGSLHSEKTFFVFVAIKRWSAHGSGLSDFQKLKISPITSNILIPIRKTKHKLIINQIHKTRDYSRDESIKSN